MQKEENDILFNTIFLAGYITIYNIKKHHKLYKDFNKKEITISNPKNVKAKFTKKDKKRIKTLKLGEDILWFKKRLEENINTDYLNNMYNNFKTINAKANLSILLLLGIAGTYNASKNSIKACKLFLNDVIDHELLHCSSTYYNNEKQIAYIGFAQIDYKNKKYIGRALNEGYTSLLVSRYFPHADIEESNAYQISKLFAKQIEKIVGKEKMEESYFKANLNILIKELEQYDTRENIIKVINSLDFILKHLKSTKDFLLTYKNKQYLKECLNTSLENIQYHLIKWYIIKLQNDLNNNLINKREFKQELKDYKYNIYKDEILEKIPKKKIKKMM